MHDELIFRFVFLLLFLGMRFARWDRRHDIGWQASWPHMKQHPWDTTLLVLVSLCWLAALILLLVLPHMVSGWSMPLPSWLRWCGAAVALAGLALLRWSDECLGKNLSVTLRVRAEHTLITRGPYARIRHPIYTAGLAFAAGQCLVAANYLLSVLLVVPLAALVAERMGREERMMMEAFGEEYRHYMQVTGRLLPRLWKRP